MAETLQFRELAQRVRPEVDRALTAAWDEARLEHSRHGPPVTAPLDAARALCLRGGKRLRAALVAAGYCVASTSRDWKRSLPVCVAVELLQAYFLIHDDWMDQDRLRRGGPAVHAALESELRSVHLAACGAVLAGDYTLALATRWLARAEVPADRFSTLLARFAQLQLDAVVGQKLDVLGDGSNLDEVYRLKTGSYSVMGPLELGMDLASAERPSRAALEAFAVPLGIAFQLRDDLIGAFADSAVSGKPRGSDLRAGKRTLLVETALSIGSSKERGAIRQAFGEASATDETLYAAIEAIEATGARAVVEARIDALAARAAGALKSSEFSVAAREMLDGVRAAMIERES